MLKKLSFYLLSIASFALPLSFVVSCSNSKDTKPNTNENPKPDENTKPNDEGGNSNGSGESNKPNGDGGQNGGNGESNKPNGDGGQNGGSGDSNKPNPPKPISPELKPAIERINNLQHKTFRATSSSNSPASGISLVLAISNGDDLETALTTNLKNSNVKLDSNVDELIKTIQELKKQNFTFTISSFSYGNLYQNYVKGVNFKITISYQKENAETENFTINNLTKIDENTVQYEINAIKSVAVDCKGIKKPTWDQNTNVFTALFDSNTGVFRNKTDAKILKLKNILEKIKRFKFQFSDIKYNIDATSGLGKMTFQIKVDGSVWKPNPAIFTLTGFSS